MITINRQEVRPFTDKQIELVKNFAAQAVIAIENTRLLNELRQSLEQQTATSEVLQVISSSPANWNRCSVPCWQTQRAFAAPNSAPFIDRRRCRSVRRDAWCITHNLPRSGVVIRCSDRLRQPRSDAALATKQPAQILQMSWNTMRQLLAKLSGARTVVSVPMLKDEEPVGAILIYRQEVRSFTDKQIELLQNFAAQAVIAIENTRLLSELRHRTDDLSEALEQQTATSEVLKIISSSPSDLRPVFQSMLENSVRICEAKFGQMFLCEGDKVRAVAQLDVPAALVQWDEQRGAFRPSPEGGLDASHTHQTRNTYR